MSDFSLAQLRELRRLSLELGFLDDVRHWDRLIAAKTQDHNEQER